jgi:hypothetical protein
MSYLEEKRMGRSKPWKVALLLVLVAMMVGFGRLDQGRKQSRLPPNGTQEESGDQDQGEMHDSVSQFLCDLFGDGSQEDAEDDNGLAPFPRIAELPALPKAFWPVPNLITRASSFDPESATY